jgi:magnesium chelatase family protein
MPHHTISVAGLLGGGNPPRPGETSLAHRGVLVLDDLPQFPRACIEGLQEPLERGVITLVRGRKEVQYPARFQLMAFMSLCPCGFLGHPDHVCVDNLAAVQRHQARVFGPLSDYFDLVVRLPPSTADAANEPSERSTAVLERILAARARQHARLRKTPWPNNAALPAEEIERMCQTTRDARKLLHDLVKRDKIDERAVVHLLRVAQTVQDLDPGISKKIGTEAIAMAVRLRRLPAIGTK